MQGLYKYVLVYGGHNLEGEAVEIEFGFDRDNAGTNPLGLSLVALTVNATHATVMLEVIPLPTPANTVPLLSTARCFVAPWRLK